VRQSYEVKLGETFTGFSKEFRQPDGRLVDVTGWTVEIQIQEGYDTPAILTYTEADGTQAAGVVSNPVPATDLADLAGYDFVVYDWLVKDSGGNVQLSQGGILYIGRSANA